MVAEPVNPVARGFQRCRLALAARCGPLLAGAVRHLDDDRLLRQFDVRLVPVPSRVRLRLKAEASADECLMEHCLVRRVDDLGARRGARTTAVLTRLFQLVRSPAYGLYGLSRCGRGCLGVTHGSDDITSE